jgi:hypothetical protein
VTIGSRSAEARSAAVGDLDLTAEEPAETQKLPEDMPLADLRPFNPALWHEWVRSGVAVAIIGAVIAETLILTIAFIQGHLAASDLSAATAAVITPLVGIAGAVLGFYFGTHRAGG